MKREEWLTWLESRINRLDPFLEGQIPKTEEEEESYFDDEDEDDEDGFYLDN